MSGGSQCGPHAAANSGRPALVCIEFLLLDFLPLKLNLEAPGILTWCSFCSRMGLPISHRQKHIGPAKCTLKTRKEPDCGVTSHGREFIQVE
jgi:hypothetical protein